MKRSFLKKFSDSPAAVAKRNIQSLVRDIVIERDGGCVLRHFPQAGACGGYGPKSGKLILQGEHLITRSNSATYGDTRNIVCLCLRHHKYWKPQYSDLYWELIEKHVGPTRWAWLQMAKADRSAHKMDWRLVEIALEKEYESTKRASAYLG